MQFRVREDKHTDWNLEFHQLNDHIVAIVASGLMQVIFLPTGAPSPALAMKNCPARLNKT